MFLFYQVTTPVEQNSFNATMDDAFQRHGSVTLTMTVGISPMKKKNLIVVCKTTDDLAPMFNFKHATEGLFKCNDIIVFMCNDIIVFKCNNIVLNVITLLYLKVMT